MIRKNTTGRRRRTLVTILASAGALALSSGIALLAAAPAQAATITVHVCHATSSDSNPYQYISVDNDAANFEQQVTAHLAHRNNPNKIWKSAGSFGGVEHAKGDPKPDLIGDYSTPDGDVILDGDITAETCAGEVEEIETAAAVTFTDPTCENDNVASYETSGENVTFELAGTVAPGEEVTVTATVDDGYVFAGDEQTQEFMHTFGAEETECDVVVEPPGGGTDPEPEPEEEVAGPTVATPTVVSAGLLPGSAGSATSTQGLALIGAGLVLLLAAGGVARPRRVRR